MPAHAAVIDGLPYPVASWGSCTDLPGACPRSAGTTASSAGIGAERLSTMADAFDVGAFAAWVGAFLGDLVAVVSDLVFVIMLLLFMVVDAAGHPVDVVPQGTPGRLETPALVPRGAGSLLHGLPVHPVEVAAGDQVRVGDAPVVVVPAGHAALVAPEVEVRVLRPGMSTIVVVDPSASASGSPTEDEPTEARAEHTERDSPP